MSLTLTSSLVVEDKHLVKVDSFYFSRRFSTCPKMLTVTPVQPPLLLAGHDGTVSDAS